MTKDAEKNYLKNLGPDGIKHANNKPFSDQRCGEYLSELGAIMSILPKPPAKLYDLGCGTGWSSFFFARQGYDVTGQDIADDMISLAQTKKGQENITNISFLVQDYEDTQFDSQFDCAVFLDSLHHSVNEEAALKSVYNALKPGGVCITSEPGFGHANNKTSKNASANYGVTEKSMPPYKIIRLGKKVGFKRFKVYPHASFKSMILYNNEKPITLAGKIAKLNLIRPLAAIFNILLYKRMDGIVTMIK